MPAQRRVAFTFFELLVILAILAMLLGFLIPAVMKARADAERTVSLNNLKQVCLAMHTAAGANNGKLPPATGPYSGMKSNQTISVHLLPYIEQQALWTLIQEKAPPTDIKIPTYSMIQDPSTKDFVRVQNIAANVRVFTDDGAGTLYNETVPIKSPMACTATINKSFPDGTSNTVAFATRYAASGTVSAEGKSTTPCGYYDLPLANNGGSFFGATPMTAKASATSASGWQLTPSLAQVNCSFAVGMAHAFTPTGIQVALADGSARFVAPALSANTWNIVLQPNDGLPLGADWE
jgi:type II secretory pathway pseudopilin PulG